MQLKIHRGLAADDNVCPRSLRGTFQGVIAPAVIPRRAVESLIPQQSGLKLAGNRAGEDECPVMILFGRQKLVRNFFHGIELTLGFGREYRELMIVVPNLELPDSRKMAGASTVSFYSRLYLDSFWPVVLGRSVYGFDKYLASFRERDDRFSTVSLFGKPLFEARVTATEGPINADRIAALEEQFSAPVAFYRGRQLVLRQFDYQFNLPRIFPVETELCLHPQLAGDFGETVLTTEGLDRNERGAIHCKMPWVMTDYLPAA